MILPTHRRRNVAFQLVAVTALLFVGLSNCVLAFIFPLELEQREGTSWLHVLTMQAGISLYDHTRVAFLNMNHGPLDPWLKHAIATVCPFLSPAMVTRFFVLLLPASLFLAMTGAVQKKLPALLWALGTYLFLLGLQPPFFLIGRSDPTAMVALAGLIWTASTAGKRMSASGRPGLAWIAAGLLSAAVVLINWRFFSAVGAVIAATAFECVAKTKPERRRSLLISHLGGTALVVATLFALVLFVAFHGDWTLYHHHFFGFFSPASGWGAFRDDAFHPFPADLMTTRWPIHLLALGTVILGIVFPSPQLPRLIQLTVWLPLLTLLWFTSAVSYYLNHFGGGIYYFGAFYVVLAHHLARAVDWEHSPLRWAREPWLIAIFCALPWSTTWQQAKRLEDSFGPAYAFISETKRVTAGARVLSEDVFLFKNSYQGEVVDMGGVAFRVRQTGYFGAEFDQTVDRYFAELASHPPPFAMTGGLGSPPYHELLGRLYRPILHIPAEPSSYLGSEQTLYELKINSRHGRR